MSFPINSHICYSLSSEVTTEQNKGGINICLEETVQAHLDRGQEQEEAWGVTRDLGWAEWVEIARAQGPADTVFVLNAEKK
jgi:hypothetical protein